MKEAIDSGKAMAFNMGDRGDFYIIWWWALDAASAHHLPHHRHDLVAIELDAAHQLVMRQGAGGIFEWEAREAERLGGRGDLAGDRLGRADIERAVIGLVHELVPAHRRPAAFLADAIAHGLVVRP